jgi:hypothetical protein
MPDEDATIVMSARVADLDESHVVPGSIIVDCDVCGQECWLSPATAKEAAGKGWPVQCTHCAMRQINEQGGK